MTPVRDVAIPEEWIAVAHRLADAARGVTLPHFRSGLAVDDKRPGNFDPVTQADRDAETAMRAILARELPNHGIIGEEHGTDASESPWDWVLDPIDGTRAFISGFPTWVTLIGLRHRGVPLFGLIDAPATGDRWIGGPGLGAAPSTRRCASLSEATLATTSAEHFWRVQSDRAAWDALCARSRLRRYGGDGLAYGLLAEGHIDAVIEHGLQLYDFAAVIPVVEGAGGVITGWDGGDPLRGHLVAAGDARVHAEILEVLRATGASSR